MAIDFHNERAQLTATNESVKTAYYSSFHIYTLYFKGEKIIEKNTLSHWLSRVSSVSWYDESTLEFSASEGNQNVRTRYRYSIADQN